MAGESKLQAKVIGDLNGFGKYIYGFKTIETNVRGTPDVFFNSLLTGPIHVELKDEGEKPRTNQLTQMKKAHQTGIRCFVVDTIQDWVLLKRYLKLTLENLKERGLIDDPFDEYAHRKIAN